MVKLNPEGDEIYVDPEILKQSPIVLSQRQAKALLKASKPPKPRSEAQIAHMKAIVEANKKKWAEQKKQKEEEAKRQAEEEKQAKTRVVVRKKTAPKVSKKKVITPAIVEDLPQRGTLRGKASTIVEDDEEEGEEESEEEEPQRIQAVKKVSKKAKEMVDKVQEIDEKINLLRSKPVNRYASMLNF